MLQWIKEMIRSWRFSRCRMSLWCALFVISAGGSIGGIDYYSSVEI